MRIIAGKFARKKLNTRDGLDTRPTSEKVRGAIFNSLGQFFDGGKVLDLFAGSGAMGIEAVSRGFDKAICNDYSREAVQVIRKNVIACKAERQVQVMQLDYKQLLTKSKMDAFDIIFLDPPYKMHVMEEILTNIQMNNLLVENGKIVLEMAKNEYQAEMLALDGLQIIFNKTYGSSQVVILQAKKE